MLSVRGLRGMLLASLALGLMGLLVRAQVTITPRPGFADLPAIAVRSLGDYAMGTES